MVIYIATTMDTTVALEHTSHPVLNIDPGGTGLAWVTRNEASVGEHVVPVRSIDLNQSLNAKIEPAVQILAGFVYHACTSRRRISTLQGFARFQNASTHTVLPVACSKAFHETKNDSAAS